MKLYIYVQIIEPLLLILILHYRILYWNVFKFCYVVSHIEFIMNSVKYIELKFCERHSGKWHVSSFRCFCDITQLTETLVGMPFVAVCSHDVLQVNSVYRG